jgi:hypothetical protein
MRIKNINGTGGNLCKCGTWLDHWRKFGGQTLPISCPVTGCSQRPEVGAHVQKDIPTDNNWYIIPLCKTHNGMRNTVLTVNDSVRFVSANVKDTCGK